MAHQRFEVSRLDTRADGFRVTESGALTVPATPTRTGVLRYVDEETGATVNEYRPPSEVFDWDSLQSMVSAPLTVDHPAGPVTADTWRELAVGHVARATEAGVWVDAVAVIADADAIKRVMAKELVELSAGYTCEVDETPGMTEDGFAYDRVQRKIRYNHVALLPVGWARAGRGAKLHVDSCYAAPEDGTMTLEEALKKAATAEAAAAVASARADQAEKTAAVEKARADRAEGELAAAKEKLRADTAPEVIEAKVRARAALVGDARVVLGEAFKADGLSEEQILRAMAGSTAPADASLDYVRGVAAVKLDAAKAANLAGTPPARNPADTTAEADDIVEIARRDAEKRNAELWKTGGFRRKGA